MPRLTARQQQGLLSASADRGTGFGRPYGWTWRGWYADPFRFGVYGGCWFKIFEGGRIYQVQVAVTTAEIEYAMQPLELLDTRQISTLGKAIEIDVLGPKTYFERQRKRDLIQKRRSAPPVRPLPIPE